MNGAPWCAMFVSWCANEAGVLGTAIPKFASCDAGMSWFRSRNQFVRAGGSYKPKTGDIIFFGSISDSTHVGIVARSDGSKVYTIEGNSSDMVKERSYALNNTGRIVGYGTPKY